MWKWKHSVSLPFTIYFLLIGTVHAASFSEDKLADPVVVCHRTWFCFQFCNLAPFSKYCCRPTSSFQISFPGSFPLSVAQKIKLISLSWYVISVSVYWSNQFSFKIIILQKSMHAKFYSLIRCHWHRGQIWEKKYPIIVPKLWCTFFVWSPHVL